MQIFNLTKDHQQATVAVKCAFSLGMAVLQSEIQHHCFMSFCLFYISTKCLLSFLNQI